MPGFLVHVGATVQCAHGGSAQPTVPNPKVTVGGSTHGHHRGTLYGRGLQFPAAALRQRPLCDRPMGDRCYPDNL